jgi:hypothetical protein
MGSFLVAQTRVMWYLLFLFPLTHTELEFVPRHAVIEVKREVEHKGHVRIKDATVVHSELDDFYGTNCVSLVKRYREDAPFVDASRYPITTTAASRGAIGKMVYKDGTWHVFYVLEIHDDILRIVDGNYDKGYVTVRIIPRYDGRIVGYY